MEFPARKISRQSISTSTMIHVEMRQATVRHALQMMTDPQKKERKTACKCVVCFYESGRIGGAAMTSQPCGICGEVQQFGSTATDPLCEKCAKEHALCKQCGSDVELRMRRGWAQIPE